VGFRGLPFFLLLAACGGGGSAPPPATLSGQLSILLAAPQLAPPSDREPNDSAAAARFLAGEPEGALDAVRDPIDAFRLVAERSGVITAELESEGVQGDAVLLDLRTGEAAAAIEVRAGDAFDVILRARAGAGRYRVRLRDGFDRTPLALPEGYCDCGDGFEPCEIVAAPAVGFDAQALGLTCVAEGPGACLLVDPRARDERSFAGLCDVLARCAQLEARGVVRYAEPNALRQLAALPDDPLLDQQWGLAQIHALAAWDLATGSSAVVAIVDSGIRNHPDLLPNLVPGYDFEEDDADPTDPTQSLSHGTQVAGVIAAAGNNGTGISGVLWSAKVMPVRAFDTAGFGTSFDIANAILYAAGLPNDSGLLPAEPASVVNLSFASTVSTTIEQDACADARAAGVFLCAATGNQGSPATRYPAGYAAVVGVGATTSNGNRASYSNFGSTAVDLVAPGGVASDGVLTTGIVASGGYDYPRVNGTSFASPHVAAVAALCMGLAPLSPDEVEQILYSTAQDIGDPGVDDETGHGIVDAYRAALAAMEQPQPVYVPYEEVEVRLLRAPGGTVLRSVVTSDVQGFSWSLADVPSGSYLLEAGTDRNRDGALSGPGELYGRWGDGAILVVDGPLTGLDFALAEE